MAPSIPTDDDPVNEVRLFGRVSGAPRTLELPSGDEVVSWRLVVDRAPSARTTGNRVDTIDCAAWTAALRRRAERLSDGESVRVVGRLRRRFWRGAAGPASRHEVEVIRLERVSTRP